MGRAAVCAGASAGLERRSLGACQARRNAMAVVRSADFMVRVS